MPFTGHSQSNNIQVTEIYFSHPSTRYIGNLHGLLAGTRDLTFTGHEMHTFIRNIDGFNHLKYAKHA